MQAMLAFSYKKLAKILHLDDIIVVLEMVQAQSCKTHLISNLLISVLDNYHEFAPPTSGKIFNSILNLKKIHQQSFMAKLGK